MCVCVCVCVCSLIVKDCCRYVLNYTVTDSLGLSAAPLQLTVIIYESAQVQASLQLIQQVPFNEDRVAARARAQLNIRQLTDASGSTANTAFRSVAWRSLSHVCSYTPGEEGGGGQCEGELTAACMDASCFLHMGLPGHVQATAHWNRFYPVGCVTGRQPQFDVWAQF